MEMQQAAEPVRMVCIKKSKVTEDSLTNMRSEMMQTMKKGKLMYDAVMKSIDTMLPDELKDDTKRAIEMCKDSSVGIKDNCDAAFTLLKCILKENPSFFFP
uniref:Odorant-binding protein 20 n=1 Tax=Propsilocerus akamusi TaxID=903466 RepID=A0A7D0PAM4_9DIPT|nr:odorant-binding protein 20 [Propsilocerus akamusi]